MKGAVPVCNFCILRELRKRSALSIADLAARSGVSASVISKLERNVSTAELDTLYRIARALGTTLAELIAKIELFKEFKAVKTGNVWSTSLNMYQESSRIADAIVDFKLAIDGDESRPLRYLTRLK